MPQTRQNPRNIPLDPEYNPVINQFENSSPPIITGANDLAEGEHFLWHQHGRAQLVYARSGVMAVTTKMAVYVVPPQRAVWMPGGIRHRIDAHRAVAMRSLYIDTTLANNCPSTPYVLQVTPLLRELIMAAFALGNDYLPDSPQSRIMQVILDQLIAQPRLELALPLPTDERLLRIIRALMADPADNSTLDEWANIAGASKRTLNRLFDKQTGLPFQCWRQQLRLQRGIELLVSGENVSQVALELGYDNASAFIVMFRRCMGMTPRHYLRTIRA